MTAQTLSVAALALATTLYAIAMIGYSVRLARVAERTGAARAEAKVAVGASSGPVPAEPVAAPSDTPSPDEVSERRSAKAAGIARAAVMVGALAHLVGVVARGVEAGHAPWSTMYEFTISGTFVAVAVFLAVQRQRDVAFVGPFVTGFVTIALGLGLAVLYNESTTLPPALQSAWLIIHVSIAVVCTGIFTVSAFFSILQLLQDRGVSWGWLRAVPSAQTLESLAFKLNAVGFVLWTFTVMAGAIWAEHAWGRYWGWDPKETWSFVIWVLYAAYLHARTTQGWTGRRAAYLALSGFVALILNFTVVNLVFQGLHSYAGVE